MHIADIELGILGANGIVGGGLPIGTGAGLSAKYKGTDQVTVCFFGDGAANQGSFHEAINLAAVKSLAVIFVCENNHWALSTSFEEATAVTNVADRASAYAIPGHVVDGNDVEAVFATTRETVARARRGEGPTLIECKTYRWKAHSVFASTDLRPREELEAWKLKDPIRRLRDQLLERQVLTQELDERIQQDVAQLMDEAETFAVGSPDPDPADATRDVYA